MPSTITEVLARLNALLGRMDSLLAGAASARARAEKLAELVAGIDDRSAGGVCRVRCNGSCLVAACDRRGGGPRADWETALENDAAWRTPEGWRLLEAPAHFQLPRHSLVVMSDADMALALLLPDSVAEDVRELLAAVFGRARLLITHQTAAELQPPGDLLVEEVKKGDIPESASVFHHELGNILNNLVLDADALERDQEGNRQQRLRDIKDSVAAFAERMGLFVQFQHSRRTPPYLVDLEPVLHRCVRELEAGQAVRLQLAGGLPAVFGTISDLHRLVRLLLGNALTAAREGQPVVVNGERQGAMVVLTITVPADELKPEEWREVFQPFSLAHDGLNGLELAVCRGLLRRFHGKLRGDSPTPGVLRFTCEFATEQK